MGMHSKESELGRRYCLPLRQHCHATLLVSSGVDLELNVEPAAAVEISLLFSSSFTRDVQEYQYQERPAIIECTSASRSRVKYHNIQISHELSTKPALAGTHLYNTLWISRSATVLAYLATASRPASRCSGTSAELLSFLCPRLILCLFVRATFGKTIFTRALSAMAAETGNVKMFLGI